MGIISGGGKYFAEKFKLGKIEGQILAGDKKAGLGPEKSGGPADPDPEVKKQSKENEEKQIVRIIGSGSNKILSSRIPGEEGKLYSPKETSKKTKGEKQPARAGTPSVLTAEKESGEDKIKAGKALKKEGRKQKQSERKAKRADKRIKRSEKRIKKHERKLKDTTDSIITQRKKNRIQRQKDKIEKNKKKKS